MASPARLKGFAITTLGVLVLSPEALLIRLVDTDLWTLVFWRSLLVALALLAFVAFRHQRRVLSAYTGLGRAGLAGSACFAGNGVLFVTAVDQTSVANTLAIMGTAPLFAAFLGLLFLRERLALRTWLAIVACLVGIGVIFAGSAGSGNLAGDLAALGAGASTAGVFVSLRAAPGVDARALVSLGALAAALPILPLATPDAVGGMSWFWLLLLGLFVAPVAFSLVTAGPRYISAAEVSLVMLLEMVLAPLLAWWVLDEIPPRATIAGGAVILATLAVYYVHQLIRR